MAATAAMAKLCSSYPSHRLSKPAKKNSPKFIFSSSSCTSNSKTSLTLSSPPAPIHAGNSPVEDETCSSDGIIPQVTVPLSLFLQLRNGEIEEEHLKYLWKLGAGSVAGAALIKYGSVLFPQITTPNLVVALVIVSTPVLVAVFLLIKKMN